MHLCTRALPWLTAMALAAPVAGHAATPTPGEIARAHDWAAANLEQAAARPVAPGQPPPPEPGIAVVANHGDVILGARGDGRPIRIAQTAFTHGLLCHAPSELIVRLPGPGRSFHAIVGVDANAGGGSIVFSVSVSGQEAFRSDVMHCGEPGVAVDVDLGGAAEFVIAASDAGDGIACDHAAWGEAAVTLEDGTTRRLQNLPIRAMGPPQRPGTAPAFSFVYGGKHSDELLPGWAFAGSSEALDENRTRLTRTYADPKTGLEVRCVSVEYSDFPVVEWTVHLRNTGDVDTPIVEGLQAIDTRLDRGPDGEFLLHHNVGSPCQPNDYQPLETTLTPETVKRFSAAGGRPTNTDLCYFNLEWQDQGVIVALGWPGQWAADFARDDAGGLRLIAGQELTHFVLRSGEEVRTPLVALLFWRDGDWIRAQNLWRQWMMAHSMPRVNGEPIPPHYGVCFGNLQPKVQDELLGLKQCVEGGALFQYYFLDAGWYPDRDGWWNTGTWEPDPERFPNGMREAADYAHANGMKFVLWFEPERCTGGTWITENHPEWVLGGAAGGLVNLGNPEAWNWVLERFDALIVSQGVDVYRQDYNIDPLGYWRASDTEDRQGVTENHYVSGYLAYWDELLRRHPGLYIDTCASGGRRNDLETLRRSVPLLRSDYFGTPTAQQAQTMGISQWMPYYGSGQGPDDEYFIRSGYFPAARTGWDPNAPNVDFQFLNRCISECAEVQRCMTGDFYPLTPWSVDEDVWAGWQWHLPDSGEGAIQAFRRVECPTESMRLKLRGLDPDARYSVRNTDEPEAREYGDAELMDDGLPVTIATKPGATVFLYQRL